MELSTVLSRAQRGVEAPLVQVETHISNGLPAFNIVGLPATAVRESRERVRSALLNSHFEWPARRLTVNLAPADLPKDGGRFDLPIALGILAASGQLPMTSLARREFVGELALDGELRPVSGTVTAAIACSRKGRVLVVPEANGATAAIVPGSQVVAPARLLELCAWLQGRHKPGFVPARALPPAADHPDMADVYDQPLGKRVLEIAASGGHNLLFSGPPGAGKTMLATRLPGILPELDKQELLEVMALRSSIGSGAEQGEDFRRPFRAPHHSASARALVGGGSLPRPGEISLAHNGVLFLDELPEFNRGVLEMLREPMESGQVVVSRVLQQLTFPARFQLIAAMNPCPCGGDGDKRLRCRCTPDQVQRYRQRLSGPLLDRIDMLVTLSPAPSARLLQASAVEEASSQVRARVCTARETAKRRQGCINALLEGEQLKAACQLPASQQQQLDRAVAKWGLSVRSCLRILRVARTIADLAAQELIQKEHLAEALAYRQLGWTEVSSHQGGGC
jgi:magnesium chelatase family protein